MCPNLGLAHHYRHSWMNKHQEYCNLGLSNSTSETMQNESKAYLLEMQSEGEAYLLHLLSIWDPAWLVCAISCCRHETIREPSTCATGSLPGHRHQHTQQQDYYQEECTTSQDDIRCIPCALPLSGTLGSASNKSSSNNSIINFRPNDFASLATGKKGPLQKPPIGLSTDPHNPAVSSFTVLYCGLILSWIVAAITHVIELFSKMQRVSLLLGSTVWSIQSFSKHGQQTKIYAFSSLANPQKTSVLIPATVAQSDTKQCLGWCL